MESAGDSMCTRTQIKHILIATIVIITALSLIASIVLITIGYMNPFGTVGLGILGGGCILYFSSILFLCSCGIWVKNKYYADETDYKEKLVPSSNEDISLLKPALSGTSPGKNEAECINETERQTDMNIVPLCSVSTVFSSVSSSASTVPDRTMLCNWQGEDAEGDLDCDVFSSSLTAMQYTDIKLQEKLKLKRGSTEQINCESTSDCKIKDVQMRKIADLAILHSNGKSVTDSPRQRKPVLMDFVGTTDSNTREKQLMNPYISGQHKGKNITASQMCGRNNMSDILCPLDGPPISTVQSKHHQHMEEQSKLIYERKATHELPNYSNQEKKTALEKGKTYTGEKNNKTPDRRWCVISEGHSLIHNPRVQVTASKGLNITPAAIFETEKKHISCEKKHSIGEGRTEVPLQNLLPNAWLAQSEKVQLSSQMATSEHLNTKGKFMMKPGTRNNI